MIPADPETLMRQAPMTAAEYFSAAVRTIDGQFGEGFAKANPALIVGFMQTAASDFNASILAQQIRAGLDAIANREG